MAVVTCHQMRALEAAAIAGGTTESALMENAGRGLARALLDLVPRPDTIIIFAGKGHNAGDAWVAARHWLDAGWPVAAIACFPHDEWRPLATEKWRSVRDQLLPTVPNSGRLVVVDALLGLGSAPPLRPPLLDACRHINTLRHQKNALVVAVDGPSGLDFDTGKSDPDAVRADLTVTIGAAKRGLLAEDALNHVGRLSVVPVAGLTPPATSDTDAECALTPSLLRAWMAPPRPYDFHKGQAGRILVVAGSRGMLGAGRLCATAAVHGGAGLVTLAVPVSLQDTAAASLPAEIMVRGYRQWSDLTAERADFLAVGPGLGRHDDAALAHWLAHDPRPAVVDADALNALAAVATAGDKPAADHARTALARPDRLLTPHPGEMRRLLDAWHPELVATSRALQARGLASALGTTVLLKGARTVIATPGQPLAHNTTGHPGMASGGLGDVLTGLCAALRAHGMTPYRSATTASWLLGRAAELALCHPLNSPESLRATLVIHHLGQAFSALRFSDA
ncbi:MAG: NAD(P)H-hydrate dehydratase [Verrucomicrobiales bacterium]